MSNSNQHTRFEQQYLSLRKKEGRLYSDEEVRQLPVVVSTHPLNKEWEIRKESCRRLVQYLSGKQRPLDILEVGCGNGWLCNQLSGIEYASVMGIDINEMELKQAKRVFPDINFIYGDTRRHLLRMQFDAIVFAASFQYFSSVNEVLDTCFSNLNEGGEVHILDTHFYSDEESKKAMRRSTEYFASNGFPAMQEFYFHHTMNELENFKYEILYNPRRTLNKLLNKNPFPWICIKK